MGYVCAYLTEPQLFPLVLLTLPGAIKRKSERRDLRRTQRHGGRKRKKKSPFSWCTRGNMLKANSFSVLQILAAAGRSFAEAHLLGEFCSLRMYSSGCDYFLAHAAQAARARSSLCLQMLTFGI
jgi:hypothetical protein